MEELLYVRSMYIYIFFSGCLTNHITKPRSIPHVYQLSNSTIKLDSSKTVNSLIKYILCNIFRFRSLTFYF